MNNVLDCSFDSSICQQPVLIFGYLPISSVNLLKIFHYPSFLSIYPPTTNDQPYQSLPNLPVTISPIFYNIRLKSILGHSTFPTASTTSLPALSLSLLALSLPGTKTFSAPSLLDMSNLSANSHANLHYGEYDEQQDQSVGQQHGSGFDPLVFHQENHDGFQYHEVPFFPQTYHQEEVAASARPYIPAVSQMTLSGNFVSHPSSNYPTHNQGESLNTANPDDCFSRRGVNGEVAFNSLHQHGIFLVPLQFYGPQTLIDVNYPKASDFATTANSSRDYIGETFSVDPFLNIINICGPANYAVLKITNVSSSTPLRFRLH